MNAHVRKIVEDLVTCPQCRQPAGKHCVYRSGPFETRNTRTKEPHPERTERAIEVLYEVAPGTLPA